LSNVTGAKARLIAFYLPQYHPIPENDAWWGKGFTEWANVANAKPLFKGHYQPHLPADLGFYDLRVPETRLAQAAMAREYGIEAFCYYHYWFAGKPLLERPFNEVLASGEPDFPFFFFFSNQSWTGIWYGAPDRILIEQTYPGIDDHKRHFDYLLRAFQDPRYLRVEGKPVFVVFRPAELPDSVNVTKLWRQWATDAGLPGLFLLAVHKSPHWKPALFGFDGIVHSPLPPLHRRRKHWLKNIFQRLRKHPTIYHYQDVMRRFVVKARPGIESFPCILPNWDNTPRSQSQGMVLHDSTPELFRKHVRKAVRRVADYPETKRLVFVKSWNEWAEGNHLEPDQHFGKSYLQVLREEVRT